MFAASKTASVSGGYQISRSLRFNSADSAYLNRTPASASNQKTWTFSAWVKRAAISTTEVTVFGKADTYISINSNSLTVNFANGGANYFMQATAVLRDPSAWYHIVIVLDTTQATAANRASMYVNGVQTTAFQLSTYTNMAQNYDAAVNSAAAHAIGRYSGASPSAYFDGYMTEVNFIDGQALTPSSFGKTDAQTGVWGPKAYSGSYGTNGFYLNFSDNSNTTAATLGKDYSGNGNNWTPNNFSVTAGVGNDSLVDVPTSYGTTDTGVGGEIRGNYCTMNPLSAGSYVTVSNGNLQIVGNTSTDSAVALSTIGVTTGLWYWETTCVATGGLSYAGFGKLNSGYSSLNNAEAFLASYGGGYRNGGQIYGADRQITSTSGFGDGDIIGIALDMTNGAAYLSKNGTFLNSGVPTSGSSKTGAVWAWTPSSMLYAICPAGGGYNNSSSYLNLGQRAFSYTAPSGFKALNTQNLPTPTIGATTATQAGKYFNAVTYTGTGSSLGVTGVGFQPDWVWVKGRSGATDHGHYDAVRGVQKQLESNNTDAETTETTGITAFGSDGFTTGALAQLNTSSATYVAWNWKANGSGSSNTSGSITSTVSANTTSGFSVVTYTGTGANATVGHGLGVAPSMVIVKSRTLAGGHWTVYHIALGNTKGLLMDTSDAVYTNSGFWNNTTPTSTVFTVGTDGSVNQSSQNQVAYCFAEVAGYSKFGSYTGNGSADGPFVYTGFRPAYLLIKRSNDTGGGWIVIDSKRNPYNNANAYLNPNSSAAEGVGSTSEYVQFMSNGFKLIVTYAGWNASGDNIIYAAFAESPFKYALAR